MQRAALGLAIVLALVGALLWWRSEPVRESARDAQVARATESLSPSETLTPAQAVAAEAGAEALGAREDAFGTSRAPVRGQLVHAEGGQPLLERKLLLLASEKNRVSETLTTDERGAFTSTRAFPRGELRAWVKNPESKATLAQHAAPFAPEAVEPWLVPVPAPVSSAPAEPERVPLVADDDEALARARVVDLEGTPLEGFRLRFVPDQDGLRLTIAESDGNGVVEVVLDPGLYRLNGGALSARLEARPVLLGVGENDLGELVVPVPSTTAFLAGNVSAASEEGDPFGLVVLQELSSGREFASDPVFSLFGGSDGTNEFRIEGLVPGAYRVCFLAMDGLEYLPTEIEVIAPAEGLAFRAGAGRQRGFRFEVHGPDGSLLRESSVLARLRGCWLFAADEDDDEIPGGYEEWLVLAPGFRPARGRFDEALIVDQNERGADIGVVRVSLEPGEGTALLCLDAEGEGLLDFLGVGGGSPLAGVELRADGKLVATSDAQGLLVVDAERAPERIELLKPGWRLLEQRVEEGIPQALFARQSP